MLLKCIAIFVYSAQLCMLATCLTISLDRATEDSLLINVECQELCEGYFKWQYKRRLTEKWKSLRGVRVHSSNPFAYYIFDLTPNSSYLVRLRIDSSGSVSNEIEGRTCREGAPPPVENLRAVETGPGWLDIRWSRPNEECKSTFSYYVSYGVEHGKFSRYTRYGYIETLGRFAIAGPYHPCDSFPEEFCVLLTDRVKEGKNHSVRVFANRLDSELPRDSVVRSITVFADPEYFGPDEHELCPDDGNVTYKYTAKSDSREESQVDGLVLVPLWSIILLVILFIVIIIASIVICIVFSFKYDSTEDESNLQPGITNNIATQTIRHTKDDVNPAQMSNERIEYETPEYEEIGMIKPEQTGRNLHTLAASNIYE